MDQVTQDLMVHIAFMRRMAGKAEYRSLFTDCETTQAEAFGGETFTGDAPI